MDSLENRWGHRGLLSSWIVLNQVYISFCNLSWHIFLSLNFFSQDFLQGILRQNRSKYFALYFQREGILYSRFVLIDESSRGLMRLLCTSKQYLILDLLRLHYRQCILHTTILSWSNCPLKFICTTQSLHTLAELALPLRKYSGLQ